MTYKEYIGQIVYSEEDGCFIGDLVGIRDIVSFHGDTLEEIRVAFEESVDDYLLTCQEFNRSPQKPVNAKEAVAG
ncbi:MAG: type II toxin-antitoxin system HicB family antitoxin [Candidatus Poribacteria bacterium]|nr:type II toxin-antitoxin system HicB family antitoxin [Candidatus Poribacteria bacterium]